MRINENNYVDKAEEAIKSLVEESKQKCRGKSDRVKRIICCSANIWKL